VKRLQILCYTPNVLRFERNNLFCLLLSCLTSLEFVEFNSFDNRLFGCCINLFQKAVYDDNYQCLAHIKEIMITDSIPNDDAIIAYFHVCYKLRQNITRLGFHSLGHKYTINGASGTFWIFCLNLKI
jgi:hypothetical protein